MKKSILFVMSTLGSGGAERSLINLLSVLDKNEYKTDLLLFSRTGALIDQVPSHVNLIKPAKEITFLSTGSFRYMLKNFSLKCLLYRLFFMVGQKIKRTNSIYQRYQIQWKKVWNKCIPLMSYEYDIAIAYIQGIPTYFVIDKVMAKRKILWVHTDYSKLDANISFDQQYFSKANSIITISEICQNTLSVTFPAIQDKFKVLYNINSPLRIRELAEQPMPKEYVDMKNDKIPVILSVGRLHFAKGFDMAIDAAAILKQRGIGFRWFIIGEGSLRKTLQTQINKNELEEQVFLLGLRRNPYPYMKYADLIVQSSRYEGKSIVLDEAKVLCRPIVATKYDSVFDQIEDEKSGILVDISRESIAEGIERLLNDRFLQEQLLDTLAKMDCGTEGELERYLNHFEGKI